jgi:protein-tyrosine phosphatase
VTTAIYQFERCFNFRDVGGYAAADGRRVRPGRLFRSMTPQFMTEAGVARLRDELGIRKIVDLRRKESAGPGAFGSPPFRRRVISFATGQGLAPETARDRILASIFEASGRQAVEALEFLVEGDGNALVHCYTGKDRTGVLIAVLLSALGVSEADVVHDYTLSAGGVAEMRAYASRQGLEFFPEVPKTSPPYVLEAPQAWWLNGVLQGLAAQGGAQAYLAEHGARPALLERFTELMLE